MKKRILDIRRKAKVKLPKENLWYFSEDSVVNQPSTSKQNLQRKDRESILREDYYRSRLANAGRNRNTKDCLYVVDWQLHDI